MASYTDWTLPNLPWLYVEHGGSKASAARAHPYFIPTLDEIEKKRGRARTLLAPDRILPWSDPHAESHDWFYSPHLGWMMQARETGDPYTAQFLGRELAARFGWIYASREFDYGLGNSGTPDAGVTYWIAQDGSLHDLQGAL